MVIGNSHIEVPYLFKGRNMAMSYYVHKVMDFLDKRSLADLRSKGIKMVRSLKGVSELVYEIGDNGYMIAMDIGSELNFNSKIANKIRGNKGGIIVTIVRKYDIDLNNFRERKL